MKAVEMIAREKRVEKLLERYEQISPYVRDLSQDIYLQLLEKDKSLIEGLVERGEIDYYVRKMIKNNIFSSTSPYYKKYEEFRRKSSDIEKEFDAVWTK